MWTGNEPQFPDVGGYGNHEYGNRVGIFRILAVLDKYGITPRSRSTRRWPTIIRRSSRRARGAAPSSSRTGFRAHSARLVLMRNRGEFESIFLQR